MLALAVAVVVCAIASMLYIGAQGNRMEQRIEGYPDTPLEEFSFIVDPPEIARVVDVHAGADGVPVAVIEGIEQGEGMLLVSAGSSGGAMMISVREGGMVVCDGVNFAGWEAVALSVTFCFLLAGVLCAWAVASLRARAWFGYEMAAYAGGAFFCLIEGASFVWALLAGNLHSTTEFAAAITGMANAFVELLFFPMVAAGVFVCASNIALIRREGAHPTNLLGVAASLAWAAALIAIRLLGRGIMAAMDYNLTVALFLLSSVVSIGICYALAFLAGVCTCAYGAAKHRPAFPRDFLIILGCGLRADGTPLPLLAGRVDAARSYAEEQEEAGHAPARFVPSGGQGSDEPWSEAEAMRRYLVDKGVADERILPEGRSTNTRENFAFSAEVIAQAGGGDDARIAFSTTNYHVFRSYIYAHDAGLAAEGIAAPTKLYFWPNAFLREFAGLLASRIVPIGLGFVAVAALYLAAEYALLLA